MKRLLVLLALAVTSAHAASGQMPEPPQLVIEAPDELTAYARRLAQIDRIALLRVMILVGVREPGPPIVVQLIPEHADLARRTPRWIAGFALSTADTVVLFPARSVGYPHDSIGDVLIHEIAHVLIARAAGGAPVPRWFHEGVALVAERGWGLSDRTQLMMAVTLERRPLDDIDAAFAGSEREAARAYALSGALVRDLLRDHGSDAVARILERLAAGETFENAIVTVTGQSLAALERAFWRATWWYYLVPFLTSSLMLWTAVVVLAVYARRARARRRAALRKKWEEEEERELAMRDDEGRDPDVS
jgi:hypothetical protein